MLVESLALEDRIKKIIIEQDGIKELFPPQVEAINQGLLNGENLVISIPTAAGKTLLAELAALKHVIELGGKVIYLCPLRALASEKFNDLKRFETLNIRVTVTSGDYDSADSYLPRYDVIVSTNEKMDALLRHQASWIRDQVSLVIIDECHLLNDQHRGPTLEILIARLLTENSHAQILALSATIGNAEDLAEWLDAKLVQSDWRPVPLKEGIYFEDHITYADFTSREIPFRRKDQLTNIALDSVHSQEQILIFTPSRRSAVSTAERIGKTVEPLLEPREVKHLAELALQIVRNLSDPLSQKLAETIKRGVTFHHAGLNSRQRGLVEQTFKKGLIKVLCATPTLAAGVNLPAKRVVVSSVYRYSIEEGSHPIKTLEYKQMCLPENTVVLTPSSEIPIQELVVGDKIIGVSTQGELIQDEVVRTFERLHNELHELSSSIGLDLVGTGEHPVWTPSGWKKINELSPGDEIAYVNRINRKKVQVHLFDLLPKEGVYVPNGSWFFKEVKRKKGWGKRKLAKFLGVKHSGSIFHYKEGRKATKIQWIFNLQRLLDIDKEIIYSRIKFVKSAYGKPFKIDWIKPDFMWLVGIIASDGNIKAYVDPRSGSLTASIRIFNKDLKILRKTKRILESFSINVKIKETRNPGYYMIEFGNTLFAKLLLKCGIPWKKKTYNVFIPEFFYSLNEELLWAYFSGVFDGNGNLTIIEDLNIHSVRISTASKNFALDLHKLLLHLGILSTITTRNIDNRVILHNKIAHFKAKNYIVIFRKKKDLIKFREHAYITKCKIPAIKYSTYHNLNKRGSSDSPFDFIKIKGIKRIKKRKMVYNIQTKKENTYFANNFLVHNCGRAGRPQFDSEGEALLLAKQDRTVNWLMDRYILREPEAVYSKLAAKPALRRATLGLIASKVVLTVPDLLQFFEKTFYGFQFEAIFLEGKIREVVDLLIGWEMIKPLDVNETLEATLYGLRVSQLYLDPETAATIAEGFTIALQKSMSKIHPVALLDLIMGTPDMVTLSFRKSDEKITAKRLERFSSRLIHDIPEPLDIAYEFRLRDFRTVLFLWDWIKELPIERLIMRYKIGSGDIQRIVETATWIISAVAEITQLKRRTNEKYQVYQKAAQSLGDRVKYGIKSDAVSLTRIKGIGRKRARILLEHGIRDIPMLLNLDVSDLSQIPGFGSELAKITLELAKKISKPVSEGSSDYDLEDFFS